MIVDAHVHLNNYHKERVAPTEEHLARLRVQMEKHALDHVMVLTSWFVDPARPSAAALVELLGEDPRIRVVEGIGVAQEAAPDWEGIAQRLRRRQVWGLKIYPGYEHVYPHDKAFQPAFDLAAKYRAPVMIHTGDTYYPTGKLKFAHPLQVDEVAVDYPDVKFVACHLGNPWFHDVAELIYKNHNVYADISGLVLEEFSAPLEEFVVDEVRDAILYSGEHDKLLYGTDWPLVKMGPYLRFVHGLKLEPEPLNMLMGENAQRLFRLPGPRKRAPHRHARIPPSGRRKRRS